MPPKVKFQKQDIVAAAADVMQNKGVSSLTARELAAALGVSTRPIFTWFKSMDELKGEVFSYAKGVYREYIEEGLAEPVPFLGVWHGYIRFAKEKPELYKLLFLTKPSAASGGAKEAMELSRDLSRESIMRVYGMDAATADKFFRDIWLVAYSFGTMIVADECAYTDEEIFDIGAEFSLAVCKAYKEIPGLAEGKYDREAAFRELLGK